MLKNNLKIAWRSIARYKGYSFINISGLAFGIACCLLIAIWVQNELNFDRFNEKAERIHRLYQKLTINNRLRVAPVSSPPLAPALLQAIPEVEQAVRVTPMGSTTVRSGDREFRERQVPYVDASFFSVFTLPLHQGDARTALAAPYSVVLDEETASKYFGTEPALGKTLRFGDGHTYTVTGVMADMPSHSHLNYNLLCSYATWLEENKEDAERWGAFSTFTYLLLRPGTRVDDLMKKVNHICAENIGNQLKRIGGSLEVFQQPLLDIHLHSDFEVDIAATNDIASVYLFSGIALIILFIACINFINLATARFANRALEVGLKKTLGASRASLLRQFFGETYLVVFMALILAALISALALPWLNAISGHDFHPLLLVQPVFLLGLLLTFVLVGTLAGGYPAFYLSSFSPAQTLKGKIKAGAASATFRRVLVVAQFTVTIALIVGTLTILKQLHFLKSKPLGFNKDQLLVVTVPQGVMAPLTVREELAAVPGVVRASLSADVPGLNFGMTNFIPEGRSDQEGLMMQFMAVDDRFLDVMGISLASGRNFSAAMKTDASEAVLINETAVKRLGWPDPVGRTITRRGRGPTGERVDLKVTIVGVVKDFHTRSLHQVIEPLVLLNTPEPFQVVSLRLAAGDIPKTMGRLQAKWARLFPALALDSFFLDETFARMYQNEERLERIFTSFALLAVVISCLGLFGLAAYMTERRTKEVGIRKVLGASVWRILVLLSGEFGQWVLLANLIAWPLAFYFMNSWLSDFAYRTSIGIGVFALAGLAALAIALLTVGFQAIKAARANPVDSLRYE